MCSEESSSHLPSLLLSHSLSLAPPSRKRDGEREQKRKKDNTRKKRERTLDLSLGLGSLLDERLVDVRDDTTTGDGSLDEHIELLITTDGELEMARCDTLHLHILGGVAGKLQHLSSKVLEDGASVNGSGGTDTARATGHLLQNVVDTADRELKTGTSATRDGLADCVLLCLCALGSCCVGLSPHTHTQKSDQLPSSPQRTDIKEATNHC